MLLVSYTGMLGKAVGVEWQHHGPLGKVERLICVMAFTLLQYLCLRRGFAHVSILGYSFTSLEWCMVLFVVLGQVTVFNRVRSMLRQIAAREWPARAESHLAGKRILVTYDSRTGNTARVASRIGEALRAEVRRLDDVTEADGYDLVVLGSPNMRGRPSGKVAQFLRKLRCTTGYAIFITYGMPVWGVLSTRMCTSFLRKTAGRKPTGVFSCKGRHAKYGTFKNHPTSEDLVSAYLFGVKLGKSLEAPQ